MRFAVAQLYHESNSFSPQVTREAEFRSECLCTGDDMWRRWQDTDSEIAGFLDAAEQAASEDVEVELVPALSAWAWPAGPIADDVYVRVRTALRQAIARHRLDGLLLSLHGACISQTRDDVEGDLLTSLRTRVGPDVPIVATLDFHANVSPQMVMAVDAVVGYQTYPHVDYRQRGADAFRLLDAIRRGKVRPEIGYTQPPLLLVPQRQWTAREPMAGIVSRAREMEEDPRVLVANVFGGFAYGDTPHAGFSAAVIADGDAALAQRCADELAMMAWERREAFLPALAKPAESVAQAVAATEGLTVLVDVGDNVGGGTPGDGTVLLAELLRRHATGAAVVLSDVDAVRECARIGVGSDVRLRVGGKSDEWHGAPVSVHGRVRMLFDGEFTNIGPMRHGIRERQGLTARVSCDGVELVLTTRRVPSWNLEQLRAVGIEPTRLRTLVVKSAVAFRAAYEPIARRIIEVDTPGLTSADLSSFPYRRVRRPVFPLDPMPERS
jgi:microcystin degradation protein MlrC